MSKSHEEDDFIRQKSLYEGGDMMEAMEDCESKQLLAT